MPEVTPPGGLCCASQGDPCPTPGLGLEEGTHPLVKVSPCKGLAGWAEVMAFDVPPGWQGLAIPHQLGAVQLGVGSAVKICSLWCVDLDVHGLPG